MNEHKENETPALSPSAEGFYFWRIRSCHNHQNFSRYTFQYKNAVFNCQHFKYASAVQILPNSFTNRQIYYCPTCATDKGLPPAKHLLSRIEQLQTEQTKSSRRAGSRTSAQSKQKAKAGGQKR